MARTYACREIGLQCGWLITAENEQRLLSKIEGHVAEVHRDLTFDDELSTKVKAAFRD